MWELHDLFLDPEAEEEKARRAAKPPRILRMAKVMKSVDGRGGYTWIARWAEVQNKRQKKQTHGARFSKLAHAQYDLFKYLANGRSPRHSRQALELATGPFATWKPEMLTALIEDRKRAPVVFDDEDEDQSVSVSG